MSASALKLKYIFTNLQSYVGLSKFILVPMLALVKAFKFILTGLQS